MDNLLIVLFSEWSEVISGDAAQRRLRLLQAGDLERRHRRRPRLRRNHSPETGHAPRSDVIVGADRDEKLLGELHFGDRRPEKTTGILKR